MQATLLACFAIGLLGSAHCIVMCGGIVSVLSGGIAPNLRKSPRAHLGYVLAYNVGRVLSYAMFGALFGALAFGLRSALVETQLVLRAAAGLLMLGLGLHLLGVFPKFRLVERVGAPVFSRVAPFAQRLLPVRSYTHAVLLGSVWGWVPCGMVYTALALATASGRPRDGALAMLAFGLGTIPAMVASGTVAGHVLARAGSIWVRRSAGVLIAAFGVMSVVFVLATASSAGSGNRVESVACHTETP